MVPCRMQFLVVPTINIEPFPVVKVRTPPNESASCHQRNEKAKLEELFKLQLIQQAYFCFTSCPGHIGIPFNNSLIFTTTSDNGTILESAYVENRPIVSVMNDANNPVGTLMPNDDVAI